MLLRHQVKSNIHVNVLPNITIKLSRYVCLAGFMFCFNACKADTNVEYADVVAAKTTPILSDAQALSYAKAVHFPAFKNPVVKNASGGFGIWRLESKQKSNNNGSYWFVRVYSSRVIPTYSCAVAFNRDGQMENDPLANCGYHK